MKKRHKKLYIINGVMGNVSSPIFTYLVKKTDTLIYGISRRGLPYTEYMVNGRLPASHIVFSIGDYLNKDFEENIDRFIYALPESYEIIFIHSLGNFVLEVNGYGEYIINDDIDLDGINDKVKRLTYEVPAIFAKKFAKTGKKITYIQLGSLSDKYELRIHHSWVSSMNLLKDYLSNLSTNYENFKTVILNLSSVLTPKELIDRPFVTTQTDSDISYWLDPVDIGKQTHNISDKLDSRFSELPLFNYWPKYKDNHFNEFEYVKRRIAELFKQK